MPYLVMHCALKLQSLSNIFDVPPHEYHGDSKVQLKLLYHCSLPVLTVCAQKIAGRSGSLRDILSTSDGGMVTHTSVAMCGFA